MRKRIFTLLAALCLLLCLLPTAAFASQTGSKTDESRSYNFDLSVGGASEVRATTGETITVTLVLKRTDAQESADMYGMQTEIEYDDTFLQLVDGSVMTAPGIRWSDLGRRTGGRAFYLNFVSFKGGEAWEPEVVVGSFQMKVIGTKGVSQLIPTNTLVSTQDGMAGYTVKDNSVSVIVTTDCTVTFESNGGTEVPSQTVQYGEKVKKPEDPIREGYHLEGWYRDLDRTQKWDFHKDTVKGNMTLYANWAEGAAAGSVTWWIIGGVGLLALLLILFSAFSAYLTPYDPYLQDLSQAKAPPSAEHLLGTDRYGRDMLSRVIVGSRTSIFSTLLLVAAVTVLGTAVGLCGGFFGGWADTVLMRVSDIFLAFPGLVFALAVAGALGGGLHNAILALAAVSWPKYARLARSQTLARREAPWMRAARLSGSGTAGLLLRHMLPNILGPILVTAVLDIGTMMMELAALSFLGLGARPPIAEWGSMMSDARSLMTTSPWITFSPGIAIFVSVMIFNLLGDAVRDYADPKNRGR